jgi:hypothetical protein
MPGLQMDVVVKFVPDKGNGTVSADLLKQLEALKKKTEEIGTLQAKAVGGIGDLAENSLKVVKNLGELASGAEKSSDAVEGAFKKIENIVAIVKGSADLFKNITEVTEALKQIAKIGETGGEAGGLAKIAAAGAKGAGEAGGEAGGAVKGLTVLLTDMGSKLGAAASIAAPYAGLATATAGIYELAMHVLGWMGAIDVSSASLAESYLGWQKAAKQAADSAKEIGQQQQIDEAYAAERKSKADQSIDVLGKRYDLIDARRRHFELQGLGQDSNESLQKFDEFNLANQASRAARALSDVEGTKGKSVTVMSGRRSAKQEKAYEENAPGFLARLGYGLTPHTIPIFKGDDPDADKLRPSHLPAAFINRENRGNDLLRFDRFHRVEPETPDQKYQKENAVKSQEIPAVPDYSIAITELGRLEHLQERALATSQKEYEVLRDKSKELHSQVRQGEELVRQAHERIGVEEGRAESSVASFAKLDQKVRDRIVSISEKYKQTGKVSVEEAKYLDRYGIAPDLTNKTLASSVGGKERDALETFGVFKGVNEAKEAEKKASEALTRAKNEERTITEAMNKLHHKMLGQDDAAFATKQLISLITEQIGKGKVDRSGLAAPGRLGSGPKDAAEPVE